MPEDPWIGSVLEERYRITSRIDSGGMATVYEATDIRLDRPVAVKIMHSTMVDDESFIMRFVREARSAARLNHPNVVNVFDQGEHDGVPFLVMEHVPGRTLRDLINDQAPFTPKAALELITPVVAALAAAHQADLVHRDIKPENVLIAADGRVKVADFGLAKAISANTRHTTTGGVLIGTVSYLAPELVIDGTSDARGDVYAAGVILYELLTGTKPHAGESPIQVAYKHVHHDIPAPSALVPGLPDYVDALVARATAREFGQRPADAGVLLRQLSQVRQALAEGIDSDPELVADLKPIQPPADFGDEGRADDAPDIFDPSENATISELPDSEAADARISDAEASGADTESSPTESGHSEADPIAGDSDPEVTAAIPLAARKPPAAARTRTSEIVSKPLPAARSAQPLPVAGRAQQSTEREAQGSEPEEQWSETQWSEAEWADGAPHTQRRSRRGPIVFVLALLLAVGMGVGAYWFGWARYTVTPSVVGLDQAQAVQEIEDAGLHVSQGDPAYSETEPAGSVLTTEPGPGERVLDGGTVTVVVSAGKERYDVPRLAGLTIDQAQDALLETHLAYGQATEKWSETIPVGQIISSDPKAGASRKRDTPVDVVVSKGRRPIPVKDWTGKPATRAESWASKRQLTLKTNEEFSDDVAEGVVISQEPATGKLFRGDTVTLVVSKGPELVEVPNVKAWGVDAARNELEGLGFDVKEEHSAGYLGLGFVFSTDPAGGSLARKGSTITLYLV